MFFQMTILMNKKNKEKNYVQISTVLEILEYNK